MALKSIHKCQAYLPNSCHRTLILTVVLCYFYYCASLFIYLSFELTSIQSRCKNNSSCYASSTKKFDPMTAVYKTLSILTYSARNIYLLIFLVADVLKTGQPSYLFKKVKFRPSHAPKYRRVLLDLQIKLIHFISIWYSKI